MTFNYKQNMLRKVMQKKREEKDLIKAYNKSAKGKKLMELVKEKHEQKRVDPSELPF